MMSAGRQSKSSGMEGILLGYVLLSGGWCTW